MRSLRTRQTSKHSGIRSWSRPRACGKSFPRLETNIASLLGPASFGNRRRAQSRASYRDRWPRGLSVTDAVVFTPCPAVHVEAFDNQPFALTVRVINSRCTGVHVGADFSATMSGQVVLSDCEISGSAATGLAACLRVDNSTGFVVQHRREPLHGASVLVQPTLAALDARSNWWGDPAGPQGPKANPCPAPSTPAVRSPRQSTLAIDNCAVALSLVSGGAAVDNWSLAARLQVRSGLLRTSGYGRYRSLILKSAAAK